MELRHDKGNWIRIRHSAEPYEELELEGSNSALAELRAGILRFCESGEPAMELPADSEFNPGPYQHKLASLSLHKTKDKILISVTGGALSISGRPDLLRLFAENLPYNAQHTSSVAYHVHFDRIGREDHMSEKSLGIVLVLKK
jgi:hypothetical protein